MNTKFLILVFLALTCIVMSKKTITRHHKKIYDLPAEEKEQILREKEELAEQQQRNAPAQAKFEANPRGSDAYDQVIEETLFFKKKKSDDSSASTLGAGLKPYLFRLNSHAFYYSNTDSQSYRDVIQALSYEDVAMTESDNIEGGKCCQNVQTLKEQDFEKDGEPMFCFGLIVGNDVEKWELCQSRAIIQNVRNTLVNNIIKYNYKKLGITDKVPVIITADPQNAQEWDWNDQTEWGNVCSTGVQQSPIAVKDDISIIDRNMRLTWDYKDMRNVEVYHAENERKIRASNMGFLRFTYPETTSSESGKSVENVVYTYTAKEISFKFPSEHTVNGETFPCEMQIHHVNDKNEPVVLSVFLKGDVEDAVPSKGTFLENLKIDSWFRGVTGEREQQVQMVPIESGDDSGISIENIVYGGATHFLKKSFYYYTGSLTTPLCQQLVKRFVMTSPATVPFELLEQLKAKIYDNEAFPNGNRRKVQSSWMEPSKWTLDLEKAAENHNLRVLRHHIDESKECKQIFTSELATSVTNRLSALKQKITNDVEYQKSLERKMKDEESTTGSEDEETSEEDSVTDIPVPKFYKTDTKITQYSLTNNGIPETDREFGNERVHIEKVEAHEVPADTRQKLISKANEYLKNINHKGISEESYGLGEQAKSSSSSTSESSVQKSSSSSSSSSSESSTTSSESSTTSSENSGENSEPGFRFKQKKRSHGKRIN